MTFNEILDRFGEPRKPIPGGGFSVRCPAHDDTNPSLSISPGNGSGPLFHCHAGCNNDDVLAAANLTWQDVLPPKDLPMTRKPAPVLPPKGSGKTTRYEIRDQEGTVVAIHGREDYPVGPKRIWWELPGGTLGLGGRGLADLPLYGVDRLVNDTTEAPAIVCEGEKAAQSLLDNGILAVGTATGSGGTPGDDALRPLLGGPVILWPDNDDVGRKHMERIGEALLRLGHGNVRRIEWKNAPPKGDAADLVGFECWRDEYDALVDDAVEIKPPPVPVRLVKTSPEENALRRDLLRHALDEGSFAKYITENFRRNDFPGVGDIFDALKRSVQETGGVDRNLIGNAVGWDAFYEFERRLPEIVQTGDRWDVAKSEMRKQIRTALHDAVRDQDDARAFALVEKLREPAAPPSAPATPVGEITEVEVEDFVATVEQNAQKELLGFKTSIYPLDVATSGFIGGETWAVSAPTGGGKTQIVSQMVNEVLLQNGRVMYLSLEMPARRILARLVGANAGLNPKKVIEGRSGIPSSMLRNKIRFFQAQRIVVRDDLVELTQIEKFVRDHVGRGEPLHLVVIDFLQNIALKGVSMQIERMATAAVRLQALARETKACVVVLSQLSNEAVREKGQGVMNFRYGNELGHAADVAIELVVNKDTTVTMFLRKNRSGAKGIFPLRWTGDYSRFETI